MQNLTFNTIIGVSGLYPLLLLLFLITIVYLRHSRFGKKFGTIDIKKNPTDQILIVAALHLLSIAACYITSLFGPELPYHQIIDLYFQISITWNIVLLAIPMLRSGTFMGQTSPFGILTAVSAFVSIILIASLFFDLKIVREAEIHFFAIFTISIGVVFIGLKYKKGWKEAFLIVNNIYFLISMFLYLFGCVLYSLIIKEDHSTLSSAINIVFTLLISSLMTYWFYFQERKIMEYNMYKIPAINKQMTNILYDEEPDGGAYSIKGRLYSLFEHQKPYLSSSLTVAELAEMLYTNKSNLSKVLNNSMNVNFNEFVNSYRVKEAIRLFKEDHDISLKDLCKRSGFRNISSFNNAFKLCTGSTPGEWCRKIKKEETANVDMEKDF